MILFVGTYLESQRLAVTKLSKLLGRQIVPSVILNASDAAARAALAVDNTTAVIEVDISSLTATQKVLLPYKERLLAATCRAEKNVPLLKKIVPHVPYINTPSELSLDWTTDKVRMRQLLRGYDKSISPKFMVVHDST